MFLQPLSSPQGIASYYRIPTDKGALIVEVPKGPAYTAGIEPGDVVIGVEDKEIKTMEELRRVIMNKRVGNTITVKINRKNDIFDAKLELRKAPET